MRTMIGYELWDSRSGNLLESFDTEAQALAAVVRTARAHGSASVETFTLARVEDNEELVPVASGADLLARATRSRTGTTGGMAGNALSDATVGVPAEALKGVIDTG